MNVIAGIIAKKVFELLWPLIQEQIAKLLPMLVDKLTALLPVIVAAAVKTITEQVFTKLPDINLPGLPSVPELAETVRETVNQVPDIDIPILSDIFDFSEFLKSR